ncbi:MAG: Ig-like domain-containing protein, partial [bacterium]
MIGRQSLPRPSECVFLLVALVCGCSSSSEPGGGGGGDKPQLNVIAVSPPNGATNVAPGTPIVVTFSAEVDGSSVTSTSFKVDGATGSITVAGSTATFTPTAPYTNGATLSVTVSGVR